MNIANLKSKKSNSKREILQFFLVSGQQKGKRNLKIFTLNVNHNLSRMMLGKVTLMALYLCNNEWWYNIKHFYDFFS